MRYPVWIHCCKWPNYDFCIPQGSVATVLKWGGQTTVVCIPFFLMSSVLKLSSVSRSYLKNKSGTFFIYHRVLAVIQLSRFKRFLKSFLFQMYWLRIQHTRDFFEMIVRYINVYLLLLLLLLLLLSVGPTVFHGKLCQIPWSSLQNFAAYCGLMFMSKLSYILFKNFCYWKPSRCSVTLATYQKNYQFFSFWKCSLSSFVVFASYNFVVLQ